MYAILAFLITLGELAAVIGSYALHSHNILYNALVYGSPFYLLMNLLSSESALWDKNPLYLGLAVFHIIKYVIIFRAQFEGERQRAVLRRRFLRGSLFMLKRLLRELIYCSGSRCRSR